jgi:HlyD family secretion protein
VSAFRITLSIPTIILLTPRAYCRQKPRGIAFRRRRFEHIIRRFILGQFVRLNPAQSAISELEETPVQRLERTPPAPPGSADTPPQKPDGKRTKFIIIVVAVAIALLVTVGLARLFSSSSSATNQQTRTASVRRGDFVRQLRVNGTVEAVSYHSIAAPRLSGPGLGTLIVTKLAGSGSAVKKGDLLVEFDRQAQIKNALDRQADYTDFVQQIAKKKADQAAQQAADETALKQAQNAVQAAALELQRNEIVSKIDAEKNQENYDEAKANYNQLKATFALKRKANLAEVRSLEIQRDRAFNAMNYAQKNTERLAILSPIDGIVVLNSIWKGGQMGEVQEGDEVRPGVPFMQVVNAGSMQVRARVNQADITSLTVGLPVRVGLDAYPELSFTGKIDHIAAIGVTSSLNAKVRTFAVLFTIDGRDPKLMPDLSAAVDIELTRKPNALLVPRDSVITKDGTSYVMAEDGRQFTKKTVKVAAMNDVDVLVESGLDEGTRVLRNAVQQ